MTSDLTPPFNDRVMVAWRHGQWMIDDMFDQGMCFFEGYISTIDTNLLEVRLGELRDHGLVRGPRHAELPGFARFRSQRVATSPVA